MEHNPILHKICHLPVATAFDDLATALEHHRAAVLVAPPGAGKTTAIPLVLRPATWLNNQQILMLAPRRIAARAAARRMATLLNEPVGATVGYRVRMETRVGAQTRIEVITEGVLTRMLQSDPELSGVGLVIFDEFHERSLDADLGLALCRDIQGVLNQTLRLLVMSATLAAEPVAEVLGNAPVITCHGQTFPVETRYVEPSGVVSIERTVVNTVRRSMHTDHGNILVFLPGAPEIRRVARLLDESQPTGPWDIHPLYGNLPRELQDAAIAPPPTGRRKIVLATDIAETSLTIDGIGVVVDSGLRRTPRFDPGSGLTRLVTSPVSQASADQRRGRAGRLGPGICYRLWSRATHTTLEAENRPEMMDADLCALALELAAWGVERPDSLCWLNPPPTAAFDQGRRLLSDLGALDTHGRISDHGRCMLELPLHPRLAHMLLMARNESTGAAACDLAAILSERDLLHFGVGQRDADLILRLEALQAFREKRPVSQSAGTLDVVAGRSVLAAAAMLRKRLAIKATGPAPLNPGRLLAWAYPDRIAQHRPNSLGRFVLASGRGAYFTAPEPLAGQDYLVVAQLDGERGDARIFLATAYHLQDLMDQFSEQTAWQTSIIWDSRRRAVMAERRLSLGALTLKREALSAPDPEAVLHVLLEGIRREGPGCLPWTTELRAWQARVQLVGRLNAAPQHWPDLSDRTLMATLEQWLAPYLMGTTRLADLSPADLKNALYTHLSRHQHQLLDQLAPTHLTVPSGSRRPVDYSEDPPVLSVRVQEMFGAVQTPAIAGGRLPLRLRLLSPAGRPVQVTQDLAGFWQTSYHAVRKELRGRYPKHPWPEDPLNAMPTARAKPRRR
jgi:ATP-dependent helicase HrpB